MYMCMGARQRGSSGGYIALFNTRVYIAMHLAGQPPALPNKIRT